MNIKAFPPWASAESYSPFAWLVAASTRLYSKQERISQLNNIQSTKRNIYSHHTSTLWLQCVPSIKCSYFPRLFLLKPQPLINLWPLLARTKRAAKGELSLGHYHEIQLKAMVEADSIGALKRLLDILMKGRWWQDMDHVEAEDIFLIWHDVWHKHIVGQRAWAYAVLFYILC